MTGTRRTGTLLLHKREVGFHAHLPPTQQRTGEWLDRHSEITRRKQLYQHLQNPVTQLFHASLISLEALLCSSPMHVSLLARKPQRSNFQKDGLKTGFIYICIFLLLLWFHFCLLKIVSFDPTSEPLERRFFLSLYFNILNLLEKGGGRGGGRRGVIKREFLSVARLLRWLPLSLLSRENFFWT